MATIGNWTKRRRFAAGVQEFLADEVPWIPIAQPGFQMAARSNVVGLSEYNEQTLWQLVRIT